MIRRKQLAPAALDDDDELIRSATSAAAHGVTEDARALRNAPLDLSGAHDDAPVIDLDLSPEDYTFHVQPQPSARAEIPSLSSLGQRAAGAFNSAATGVEDWTSGQFDRRVRESNARSAAAALAPQTGDDAPLVQAPSLGNPAADTPPPSSVDPTRDRGTETISADDDAAPLLANPKKAPGARRGGFESRPGEFGATPEEEAQLARARRQDVRSDRWRRALGGIGGMLGVFGAATGNRGLAGLGAAAMVGGNAVRPHNSRQDELRESIGERMRSMQAEREARGQAENAQATRARQAMLDERAGRMDDAQIANLNARTEATQAEQAQSQMEAELERGNLNGARGIFRSFVGSLNSDAEAAQMARQFIASRDFENATAEDLRNYGSRLAMLANNRHSGLLTSGGGGHGQTVSTWDPATRSFVDRHVGGGGQRPAPTLPPTFEEIQTLQAAQPATAAPAPAAAPAPRSGGHGRPRPAPAPSPTPPAPGGQVALPTEDEALVMAVQARGIDPNTPEGLAYAASLRRALQSRDEPTARAADAEIRTALAENAQADGLPPDVPRDEWRQRVTRAEEHANAFHALRPLLRTLHTARPDQIAAALHGGAALSRVAGASALRRRIAAYYNQYYHHFGGANITPSESERYQTAFGADSVAIDPAQFRAAMNEAQQLNSRQAQAIIQSISRRGPEAWAHYRRTVLGIGGDR